MRSLSAAPMVALLVPAPLGCMASRIRPVSDSWLPQPETAVELLICPYVIVQIEYSLIDLVSRAKNARTYTIRRNSRGGGKFISRGSSNADLRPEKSPSGAPPRRSRRGQSPG